MVSNLEFILNALAQHEVYGVKENCVRFSLGSNMQVKSNGNNLWVTGYGLRVFINDQLIFINTGVNSQCHWVSEDGISRINYVVDVQPSMVLRQCLLKALPKYIIEYLGETMM